MPNKTKKTVNKTEKKEAKKEKVVKVEMVLPKVEVAPETYKQDPEEQPEPTLLPSDPTPKPAVNPNDPKIEGIDTGFKQPSITNVKTAYTYEQFKALMKGYKKQNPAKYKAKKSELVAKLRALKG